MEEILNLLKRQLISSNLLLNNSTKDGRLNSSLSEESVLDKIIELKKETYILARYELYIPKARFWYDFALEKDNKFIPVNIKVSDFKNADNVNSKEGIYYAFTGSTDFNKIKSWKNFLKEISINKKELDVDYYFLIINKNNTKDIFVTSIKCLNEITKNKNNLPFQCKWNKNRIMINKNFDKAYDDAIYPIIKALKELANDYEEIKPYHIEMCERIENEEKQESKVNDFKLNKELIKEKNSSITDEQIKKFEDKINFYKEENDKLKQQLEEQKGQLKVSEEQYETLKDEYLTLLDLLEQQNAKTFER